MMTLCSAFCLLSRNAYSSSHSVGITYDYRVRLRRTSPLGVLIPEIPTVLPVELIDFRPRGCRRLDQLLLDLFLDALEPAFGADSAVLRAFDLGLEPVDPVFGGPQLLARLLQHLDDGAAGLLRGTAGAARFLRCESAHRFGYAARALTDRCRAVRRARAPRRRSVDRRRGIRATEHELELAKLDEDVLDPVPQFVIQRSGETSRRCPPELAERKCLLVNQRPQREVEACNLERRRRRARAGRGVAIGDRAGVHPRAYRQQRRLREPALQAGIGRRRLRIRVDDEENERLDRAAASLLEESDLFHHGEEILERAVADIDDVGAVGVSDQLLEQCHLAEDVIDLGDLRELRQVVDELRSFVGQIERGHGTVGEDVELGEQPRKESFSDAPARRADDVERGGLVAHATALWHGRCPPLPCCVRSPSAAVSPAAVTGRTAARAMVSAASRVPPSPLPTRA